MRLLHWVFLLWLTGVVHGLEFKKVTHAGKQFTICRLDPGADRLHLFLRDTHGQYLKSFEGIDRVLALRGQRLVFGMNAGMFHPGLVPVGWFVTGGQEVA